MKNFLLGLLVLIGIAVYFANRKTDNPRTNTTPQIERDAPPSEDPQPSAVTPAPTANTVAIDPPTRTVITHPQKLTLQDCRDAVAASTAALNKARADSLVKLLADSAEYRRAKQSLPALKTKLEEARRGTNTEDKLIASQNYNDARAITSKAESEWLAKDGDIRAAERVLADAQANLAKAENEEAARLAKIEAIKAAYQQKVSAARRPLPRHPNVEDIGLLPPFEVVQVQSESGALIMLDSGVVLMLEGISTKNTADGQYKSFPDPVEVYKTQTYATLLGQKTVLCARPYRP